MKVTGETIFRPARWLVFEHPAYGAAFFMSAVAWDFYDHGATLHTWIYTAALAPLIVMLIYGAFKQRSSHRG